MSVCPECGAARAGRASRGPLTTQLDPPGAWWHGRPLARLSPYQHQVLHALCQRGCVSHLAIQLIGTGEQSAANTASVLIHHLRRRLPEGLAIGTIRGWGYRLALEAA